MMEVLLKARAKPQLTALFFRNSVLSQHSLIPSPAVMHSRMPLTAPFLRPSVSERGVSFLGILFLLCLCGFAMHTWFFTVVRVRGKGMAPTLDAGSAFIVKRRPYAAAADVRRGDVVVFDRAAAGKKTRFVWRVIALPGDTLAMDRTNVWLNGKPVPHGRSRESQDALIFPETNGGQTYEVAYAAHSVHPALPLRITVPPDQFFVLGDNRHEANDSTFLGPISFEEIVAKKL